MKRIWLKPLFITLCLLVLLSARAYDPNMTPRESAHVTPDEYKDVGVVEHQGENIDLNLTFKDEDGVDRKLSYYFKDGRPVLMTLVYYACPSLCNFHLNGLTEVLKKMKGKMGTDYHFLAISIDPNEGPSLAGSKKIAYLDELGDKGTEEGWTFLTGEKANIDKIAKQVGFKFKWVEKEKQYAHAAVAYIMTPTGVISRYLYGIKFTPETLRLSLVEASEGKLGSIVDRFVLFCFQFDPSKSKYTLYAFNIMRAGALLVVIVLAIILIPLWLRDRNKPMLKGEE